MTDGPLPGSREAPIPRRAARVLLVDPDHRLLLFHGYDPAEPGAGYWFTAGGGLEPGESAVEGAAREVREETGLDLSAEALGEPVYHETADIPFGGGWFRQAQDFYLVRVEPFEVDLAGLDAEEQQTIDAHRWWPLDELARTSDPVYPIGLAALTRAILGL